MDYKTYISQSQCNITLDSMLNVTGKSQKYLSDYSAYFYRTMINESSDSHEAIKEQEEKDAAFTISNLEISTPDSTSNQLKLTYDIASVTGISNAGDLVYFSPSLDPFFPENPFKLEHREFPVEFNYPYQVQRMYSFVIPENYEISELPQPVVAKLPDHAGSFRFNASKIGNQLNINSFIQINKSLFLPTEYDILKSFMQIIVDKEKEMIILKSRN